MRHQVLWGDLEPTRTPLAERPADREEVLARRRELSGMARNSNASYDVSLDGHRFLMIQQGAEDAVNQLNVVLGWADELTRRARVVQP
jgi:hypothetical protein